MLNSEMGSEHHAMAERVIQEIREHLDNVDFKLSEYRIYTLSSTESESITLNVNNVYLNLTITRPL